MQEPPPEFQKTADLSPLSPSPLHSAAVPAAVPSLQDQAATLEAMASTLVEDDSLPDTVVPAAEASSIEEEGDDSFDDAYGEDDDEAPSAHPENKVQTETGADDYAKTFDSPEDRGAGDAEGEEDGDVSEAPESMNTEPSPVGETAQVLDASVAVAPSAEPPTAPAASPARPSLVSPELPSASSLGLTQPQPSMRSRETSLYDTTRSAASDIQQLVADLTAPEADEPSSIETVAIPAPQAEPLASSHDAMGMPISASFLPPKPQVQPEVPTSHEALLAGFRSAGPDPAQASLLSTVIAPPTPGQPSTYVAAGAPGTSTDAISSLPPPPATALNAPVAITSLTAPPYPSAISSAAALPPSFGPSDLPPSDTDYARIWEQFLADERRYTAEADWDRFPNGSRIFIGNLSSDRVSKRDVFDLFHKYGRLAQISLKAAYGFVQYHNTQDAQAAMEVLQGTEIRGRKIHLEYTRSQKKEKGGKDRAARSPDREGRGRDGHRQDRFDERRQNRGSRDDYRPGRNQSPRRNEFHGRDGNAGRDRGYYDNQRRWGRSRSPPGYSRQDQGQYRRRSPSPYGRQRNDADRLDIPKRYGAQVPDVQILVLHDVGRAFVSWVERAFVDRGLKTETMDLNTSIPKEAIIQRQVVEGVHAVIELDMRAREFAKIPLQVFNRSGGVDKVNFDQYQDLDPPIAAELVLRAKHSAPPMHSPYQAPPSYGGGYQQPHPAYAPPAQPMYPPQPSPYSLAPQQPTASATDIASMAGHLDNATLQRLLASLQPQGANAAPGGFPPGQMPPVNAAGAAANSQVDLRALLSSLKGTPMNPNPAALPTTPTPPTQGHGYGVPNYGPPSDANGSAGTSTNAQVQNIMANLARFRK